MTKDKDFTYLLGEHDPPPQVLRVTIGYTSNAHMWSVLKKVLPGAVALFEKWEPLVEIGCQSLILDCKQAGQCPACL